MAVNWRLWRTSVEATARPGAPGGVHVSVGGSVVGDLVVGDNNVVTHIHEAPAEKPLRLRMVESRPVAAVDLQERPDALKRLLDLSENGAGLARALVGARGVGKTQLAALYSRMRDDEDWEVVVWLPAESENALVAAWAQFAAQISTDDEPTDPAVAARSAIAWLENQPIRSLIVYDNATDPDIVNRWRPTGDRVEVLVTTNQRQFRGMGTLIDVGVFGAEQAVEYLVARSGLVDRDAAAALATELGYLPLALAQAAALIGADRRYRTFDAYRHRLASIDIEKVLPRTPGDPYPIGLAQATLIAVSELDEERRTLLDVLSMLSPDGIDVALLAPLSEDDPDALDDWLQDLVDRSLTTRSDDGEHVLVHRMIRRVLQEAGCDEGRFGEMIMQPTIMLLQDMSYDDDEQWPLRFRFWNLGNQAMALHESIVAMLGNDPGLENQLLIGLTALLEWFAWHLNQIGDAANAIQLGEHVVREQSGIYDEDDPALLPARNNLASAYRGGGRVDDAIDLYRQTFDDAQRILGPDDERTLLIHAGLGGAYDEAGLADEAVAVYQDVLAGRLRVLGAEHPATLGTRTLLGSALAAAGHPEDAIRMHEANVADHLRLLGPDAVATMSARNSLASAYRADGQVARAIGLHEENLEALERLLGADHFQTMISRQNLALAYEENGQFDLAVALFDTNFTAHLENNGQYDPETILAANLLGHAYQSAGYLDHAISWYEDVLVDAREALGDDHAVTVQLTDNLEIARLERGVTAGDVG